MSSYWILLALIATMGFAPTKGNDPEQPVKTEEDPFKSYMISTFKEAGAINTPNLYGLLVKVISETDAKTIIEFFTEIQKGEITEELYQRFWSVNVRNCDKFRDHLEVFDEIINNMKKVSKQQIHDMYVTICDLKAKGYNETGLAAYLGSQALKQSQGTDPKKIKVEENPFKSYILSVFKEAGVINVPQLRSLLNKVISLDDTQSIIDFFDAIQKDQVTEEIYQRFWSVNVRECAAFRDHLEVFDPIIANMKKVTYAQIHEMYVTICKLKAKGYNEKTLAEYLGSQAQKQNEGEPTK